MCLHVMIKPGGWHWEICQGGGYSSCLDDWPGGWNPMEVSGRRGWASISADFRTLFWNQFHGFLAMIQCVMPKSTLPDRGNISGDWRPIFRRLRTIKRSSRLYKSTVFIFPLCPILEPVLGSILESKLSSITVTWTPLVAVFRVAKTGTFLLDPLKSDPCYQEVLTIS